MPFYMTQFSYTAEAWATMSKNPVDRSEAVRKLAESLGAKMLSMYYSFGEYDGLVISEAADDSTAAAISIAAVIPGHIKSIRTTKLLTTQEGMEVMRKAGGVSFQAPR